MITKCNGEAHSNPFIDNCPICIPNWGWYVVWDEKPELGNGIRHVRKNPIYPGSWLSVSNLVEMGNDVYNGEKWRVVCHAHGRSDTLTTLKKAMQVVHKPSWCQDCINTQGHFANLQTPKVAQIRRENL